MSKPGKLHIKVLKAKLTRNTVTMGQMSTFTRISYNGASYNTVVQVDEGQTPEFNQGFIIPINDVSNQLVIEVYHKDSSNSDELVGGTQIKTIYDYIGPKNGMSEDFDLFYKSENVGRVYLTTGFKEEE